MKKKFAVLLLASFGIAFWQPIPVIAYPIASVKPDPVAKYYFSIEGKKYGPYENFAMDLPKNGTIVVETGTVQIFCENTGEPLSSVTGPIEVPSTKCGGNPDQGGGEVIFPKNCPTRDRALIIISPRSSLISTPKPKIQWRGDKKTKKYILSLYKNDIKIYTYESPSQIKLESDQFGTTESIDYPSNWEEIQEGSNYEIKIQSADSTMLSSSEKVDPSHYQFSRRGIDGLGFRLLDKSTKDKILDPSIRRINTRDERYQLSLSFIYRGLHLHSEAIQLLEKDPDKSIETYRYLAQYYGYSGLDWLAKQTFENAKKGKNLEELKNVKIISDEFDKEIDSQKCKSPQE
jgi:hypothetical protein